MDVGLVKLVEKSNNIFQSLKKKLITAEELSLINIRPSAILVPTWSSCYIEL